MRTLEQARPTQLQSWLLATRPRTLPAAITPVIVGTALAARDGSLQPVTAVAALLSAVLIQIGANFHNDLSDFKRGTDNDDRLGPTRVTSAGLLTPQAVERGTWVVFGLAAFFGLYLIYRGGWPILILGIAAILSALAYTAGPYPLGYHGLGELFVFIFFGLAAVAGTHYVQSGRVSTVALLAAIPMGALITNILVVNNVRDVDGDRLAGKRTTAVIFGRKAARAESGGPDGGRLRRALYPLARIGSPGLGAAAAALTAPGRAPCADRND